ncbi:MAG: hypothetical protein ACYS4W_04775, partial [Planctomycetota bacterium]
MNRPMNTENRTAASHCVTIAGWLAMVVFACHACTHMVGAGCTWLALTAGRHHLNHGVDTADPFSGNS